MSGSANLVLAREAWRDDDGTSRPVHAPPQGVSRRGALTVGLLWHSVNSANLGVGALTAANMAIIEEAAAEIGCLVDFVVFGWFDSCDAPYITQPNISVQPIRARSFRPGGALTKALEGCDLVFDIGGGDSFADIYGWKRFFYMALSKWLVMRLRRPLILSPQTIGPFRGRIARSIARHLIRRSDEVFARDTQSIDFLRAIGVRTHIHDAVDVAFRLPYTPPTPRPAGDRRVAVGINISALLYYGGYAGGNMFGMRTDYKALTHRLLEHFSAREDCEVVLVPHVISLLPQEDDYGLARALADHYPGVSVAPCFASPSHAKSFIAKLDFFTGSRMHACIAAFSTGVPVIPLAYSRKFSGLFATLNYSEVVDCVNLDTEAAVQGVIEGFARRESLRPAVTTGNCIARDKLRIYETVVRDRLKAAYAHHVASVA